MIYTVTFNPSLDYIVSVENFQLGLTNRTSSEMLLPGGKGINVSTVLMNLGIESTAPVSYTHLVHMPNSAETHIQNMAPGPPIAIAPATPAILPVPTVAASAVHTCLLYTSSADKTVSSTSLAA